MKTRTLITSLLALGVAAGALVPASLAASGDDHLNSSHQHANSVDAAGGGATTPVLTEQQRKAIVKATKRFRKVDAAIAAGYQPTEVCIAAPDLGAMGYHNVNPEFLADGVIDPQKPEILLFHKDEKGGLRLGGVEYFAADSDQDLATDADRPFLHGHPFDGPMPGHEPGMPVHYDLHVWLYSENPAGELATWNPEVTCP